MAAVEDRHWWYRGMRAIARDLLGDRGSRDVLLDAGCGTGGWLAALPTGSDEDGGTRLGVDIHTLATRAAKHRGQAVARATLGRLPFADGTFDTVTSVDVLYHRAVVDDVAALAELRRVLRPNGRLLLQLPAFEALRSAHDEDVATRERYRAGVVRERLALAGFEIERLTYANSILFPMAAVWRLATRHRRGGAADLTVPPAPLNRGLGALLNLERAWLSRWNLPWGLSIIAVAHPRLSEEHAP